MIIIIVVAEEPAAISYLCGVYFICMLNWALYEQIMQIRFFVHATYMLPRQTNLIKSNHLLNDSRKKSAGKQGTERKKKERHFFSIYRKVWICARRSNYVHHLIQNLISVYHLYIGTTEFAARLSDILPLTRTYQNACVCMYIHIKRFVIKNIFPPLDDLWIYDRTTYSDLVPLLYCLFQ